MRNGVQTRTESITWPVLPTDTTLGPTKERTKKSQDKRMDGIVVETINIEDL